MAALRKCLAAETQAGNHVLVFLFRALLDVIQQLAALGNEGEKSAARGEVLLMDIEVIRKMENPLRDQRDLIWGTTSVSFVELIVFQVDFLVIAHVDSG